MENLENLSFGKMIDQLKVIPKDSIAFRKGWNGKNMFIFIRPAETLQVDFIEKVKSLPDKVKKVLVEKGKPVEFLPYLCMFTADGKIINGWLASQTDLLANDWQIEL